MEGGCPLECDAVAAPDVALEWQRFGHGLDVGPVDVADERVETFLFVS